MSGDPLHRYVVNFLRESRENHVDIRCVASFVLFAFWDRFDADYYVLVRLIYVDECYDDIALNVSRKWMRYFHRTAT
jgi:hypothetical protein